MGIGAVVEVPPVTVVPVIGIGAVTVVSVEGPLDVKEPGTLKRALFLIENLGDALPESPNTKF